MAIDSEVLDWLREVAAAAESWESVRSALQEHDSEGGDPRLRPFVFAFGFHLHERSSNARERAGGPFGAMVAGDGWRFPPALEDIEDSDVEAWREAFESVEHHVVQARLGDLLWERKAQPRPDLAAAAACDALLDVVADEAWRIMDRVRCLSRALELARETRDPDRQTRVVDRMLAFARTDLESEGGGPGASLGALRPLVALPVGERPEDLDGLLQLVVDRYGQDPYITDSVADLRSRLLDPDARKELHREQVQRWRDEATKGDGMLRVHRLEHALEIARSHGLKAEADELRRELGTIRPDDLGLERISADLEIPTEEVERFLGLFDDAPTWQDALRLLAAQPAPGGEPEDLAQQVDQMMTEFPIQYLFTKVLIGPDNATAIFRANEPEAHRRLAMAEERARAARIWGIFCADALNRIGKRADRPNVGALTEFFSNEFIEAEVAERLARAVELFWEGLPDESAHILIPRLERVLREMARLVGIPIVREPRPDREIGGVELLGALLRDLEGAFADKAWHAYLANLLVDPLGLNLRNIIAHGLHGTVGYGDAALLVQAALLLAGMSQQAVEHPSEPPPGAGPAA